MHLLTLNAAGKQLAAPKALPSSRRRLSQVIGRHVDRSRPYMVAVQRARDPLQPIDEAWVTRGRDAAGKLKPWPRTYLPADAIVVVVYLPRGGGSAGGRSSGKGFASIAMAVAAVAMIAFAGPIAGALLPASSAGIFGASTIFAGVLKAGIAIGGVALLSLASQSKANKTATDTTQVYGVAGGGNLPRPGDRIPRGYGRSWMKPDLSQPDFSQYDGDDQILFKRHTLGLGRYEIRAIRAGKQVIWEQGAGFVPPFADTRNAVERTYGTASTLVPSNVVSATGIGGLLPRPEDFPSSAGPFLINQRGALVSRLQIDFQFPQGISRTYTGKTTTLSNQPGEWSVVFQYAAIDETGAITGPWQDLYASNSGIEGARFATHPLRYTKFKDVPPGRYAVRGWNVQPDTSANTGQGIAAIDAVQWDAASGWVADTAIRPGITEIALRIYATKATQAAAFGEIEVDAQAVIPVWTGTEWVEQETSKSVWAFLDIMRNQDYGAALPDSQLDLGTALGYAQSLDEFDTFDGVIRGPVSVYEAAATVLLPMRAEPVHLGRFWSLVRDEPKAVRRHLISRRQILKGSTQITFDLDTAAGAGHVIGEFDDGGDYRNPNQCTALYGEASLTPTRQRWTGVRTFEHAQHLTRWRAASGAWRRQTTPFSVEMEGRIYKRGDSIGVDVWFIDRQYAVGVLGAEGDTLTLDTPVSIPPDCAIALRDPTGREWGPLRVFQGARYDQVTLDPTERAAIEAATGLALGEAILDGGGDMTSAVLGPFSVLTENYLIQAVKPDGPDKAAVEAVIDDSRVWEAIGAPIVVPPVGAAGIRDPETPRIVAFEANAVQIAAGLRCDYAISPGRGAVGFEVGLSYDDGSHYETIYTGTATTGSQVLNPVDPTTVMLRARAFGASGLPGAYFYTLLALPRPQLADSLLDEVNAHFAELEDLVAQATRDADKILADAQAQLAAGVLRLRQQVQEIAEAAATVEGNTFERNNLTKLALQGRTQDAFAAIQTVDEARVSDKEAFAQTTSTLATRLGTAESAISTETTARSTADEAMSSRIDTAYSRLTSAELSISGQASASQGISTRVTTAEGTITSLSQSYTTLNSQLSTLDGKVTGNGSAITNLSTTVTNQGGTITSQGQAITALQNTVNNPTTGVAATASAFSTLTTRVTSAENLIATRAEASTVDALVVSVGNQSASLTQINQVIFSSSSGNNTLSARYGIIGNINGQTGGFQLTGILKNDGTVSYNVEIQGGLIVTGSIRAPQLAVEQLIVNGQIFDNAISTVKGGESSQPGAGYTYTNSRGVGTRLAIFGFFTPNSAAGGGIGSLGRFQILINGTVYKDVPASSWKDQNNNFYCSQMAICKQIDVGPGSFYCYVQHTNGFITGQCDILVMEISK